MEDVENQIKLLQAKIAALNKSKAALKLAEVDRSLPRSWYDARRRFRSIGIDGRGVP